MAKSYWVSAYRSIRDQEAFAAYARLAGPALEAAGGRFLARGMPAHVYEGGLHERIVLLEGGRVILDEPSSRLSYERLLPHFEGELQ